MSQIEEVAAGLQWPEGPIALEDGGFLVVEIRRGTLTRVLPDGGQRVVAQVGGGPTGAAVGPDGAVYVCNNGGLAWREVGGRMMPAGLPPDHAGGSIQRVELEGGKVETLYPRAGDVPLRSPNDIVFDATGGFWFTDFGRVRERERDRTGVFYARADGSLIREAIFPLDAPNGIGLSPDGKRLYVAETFTGRLFAWDLSAPGEVVRDPRSPHGGRLVVGLAGMQLFDSLAVDVEGNVCVATLVKGAITIVSPDGSSVEQVALPDPFTTNICFGGDGLRRAYITLSSAGRLVGVPWKTAGLRLAF
jgi:gluconolactonase